jgi:hypothetical protein
MKKSIKTGQNGIDESVQMRYSVSTKQNSIRSDICFDLTNPFKREFHALQYHEFYKMNRFR